MNPLVRARILPDSPVNTIIISNLTIPSARTLSYDAVVAGSFNATFYPDMQKVILLLAMICAALSAGPVFAKPNRVVLGYSATWRNANSPAECYNFDALTHLARAFLVPHPDGTVEVPQGYFNTTMETQARQHGVKLLMSLGGEASNADNWLSIARRPEYLQKFCGDIQKLLVDHGYDGIDIDWEPSATTTEDGLTYTSFLKTLRTAFPTESLPRRWEPAALDWSFLLERGDGQCRLRQCHDL